MRVALTGATGLVGQFILADLLGRGHDVRTIGRRSVPGVENRTWSLGETADLPGCDALVHAAFSHVPDRYRGGEGDDPEGFLRLNRDGSLRLFGDARQAGVQRIIFLSSRAVYGDYPAGTALSETMQPRPDTLYGRMKHEVEQGLAASGLPAVASLRATGVYGPPAPGQNHKWQDLFSSFAAGEAIAPRISTEVHGADLAAAVSLLLDTSAEDLKPQVFNVSDIVLDRRDLLMRVARLTGQDGNLPPAGDPARVSAMTTGRLRDLGWRPRGMAGLDEALRLMLKR